MKRLTIDTELGTRIIASSRRASNVTIKGKIPLRNVAHKTQERTLLIPIIKKDEKIAGCLKQYPGKQMLYLAYARTSEIHRWLSHKEERGSIR